MRAHAGSEVATGREGPPQQRGQHDDIGSVRRWLLERAGGAGSKCALCERRQRGGATKCTAHTATGRNRHTEGNRAGQAVDVEVDGGFSSRAAGTEQIGHGALRVRVRVDRVWLRCCESVDGGN